MKKTTSILVALTFVNLTLLFYRTTGHGMQFSDKFDEREEIKRAFTLPPGALVKIFSISGPVEIRTTDGNMANVHVVRRARSREAFMLKRFRLEQTANGLMIGTDEYSGRDHRNAQTRDQVVLELPRRIRMEISSISGSVTSGDIIGPVQASSISGPFTIGNVGESANFTSISGALTVGNVAGPVKLTSISGPVQVEALTGHLHASSVSGKLSTKVARLDAQGIQLRSISGPVELRFQDQLNADLEATSISGPVYVDVPNAPIQRSNNLSELKVRIGSGGSPISLSSVSGSVRIEQN